MLQDAPIEDGPLHFAKAGSLAAAHTSTTDDAAETPRVA
jgi:hypothetical protein